MTRRGLTFKIVLLTLLTGLVGIGLVVGYFLVVQNRDLVQERESAAEQQTAILFESIKNNMLVGRAPLARALLQDLKNIRPIREIVLFRANGQEAFSDNETIRLVNQALGESKFELSEERSDYLFDQSALFHQAVQTQQRQIDAYSTSEGRQLVYYLPLRNEEDCSSECHTRELSLNPDVRGVIRVTTSLGDVDRKIRQNMAISLGIWVISVVVLTLFFVRRLDRIVLKPIQAIGEVAGEVEQGNLRARVTISSGDEIGYLSGQINQMIVGLDERLKLSKFVSQSTLQQVASGADLVLGGEKHRLTVLFSDVRGFTAYAERHDAQEVIETLNTYMQRQADLILRAGGDVDQFVGDEILGVFRHENMALDAVQVALDIITAIEELNRGRQQDIHVGIGIHTGWMIEGNIGSQGDVERLQRTVIGDAVNLGSRICGVAGSGEILISQATYQMIEQQITVGERRTVRLKGKQEPVVVYPVQGLQKP
jgi:adenylate cyclase